MIARGPYIYTGYRIFLSTLEPSKWYLGDSEPTVPFMAITIAMGAAAFGLSQWGSLVTRLPSKENPWLYGNEEDQAAEGQGDVLPS
jgi:hypothetical protein